MDATGPIVCHITQQEQIVLGRTLMRVHCKNRAERNIKLRAFASVEHGGLGLNWVRKLADETIEQKIAAPEALGIFQAGLAEKKSPLHSMSLVMDTILKVLDPYYKKHGNAIIKLNVPRDIIDWVMTSLETNPPGEKYMMTDDFVIAELEDRFGRARVGDYKLPVQLLEPIPGPADSTVPEVHPLAILDSSEEFQPVSEGS